MKSININANQTFSIIIPFYQKHDLLDNTLWSIQHQIGVDYTRIEVILVDDGSSVPYQITHLSVSFSVKYIYLPRSPESCRARARNQGIALAKNKILVFIDGDIILPDKYLYNLSKYFSRNKRIAVIGTRIFLKTPIQDMICLQELELLRDKLEYFEFRHKIFARYSFNMKCIKYPWLIGYTCNMAVDRFSVQKVKGFDEQFISWGMEDVEFSYRLYKLKVKFYLAHEIEVFHQFHEHNKPLLSDASEKGTKINFDIFCKLHPEVLKKIPYEDLLGMFMGETSIHRALNNLPKCAKKQFNLYNCTSVFQVYSFILYCILFHKQAVVYDYSSESNWSVFFQNLHIVKVYYFPVLSRPYILKYQFKYSC